MCWERRPAVGDGHHTACLVWVQIRVLIMCPLLQLLRSSGGDVAQLVESCCVWHTADACLTPVLGVAKDFFSRVNF